MEILTLHLDNDSQRLQEEIRAEVVPLARVVIIEFRLKRELNPPVHQPREDQLLGRGPHNPGVLIHPAGLVYPPLALHAARFLPDKTRDSSASTAGGTDCEVFKHRRT